MDPLEVEFRKRPRNPLILRSYISFLYEHGHILEACYYCDSLRREHPEGFETNRLAFQLSIACCDSSVGDIKNELMKSSITDEQLYTLYLHYYYSFMDVERMKTCASALLDLVPTENYTCEVLFKSLIKLEDIEMTVRAARYILPHITPTVELVDSFRRIFMNRIIVLLKMRCNK